MDQKTELNHQIHAGRRRKLRERFLAEGLTNFQPSEVLEFALGFCIPRQDTNPASHSLLNIFGSLGAVVDANPNDLANAYGIGENASVFLHFLKEFAVYLEHQHIKHAKIDTPAQARQYLEPLMRAYTDEQFVIVCLDFAGRVKTLQPITNHESNKVSLNMREIMSIVLATKARKVIIAHNHLNENPEPSVSDMSITRRLAHLFYDLDVQFLDHLIFSPDGHYSFVCSGVMDVFKKEASHKL